MIVADTDFLAAPTIDADLMDVNTDVNTDARVSDRDDRPTPVKRLKRRFLNPEGNRVQVITEWWEEGSAPVGRDADPDPDMPGHVVTQFVRRIDEDGEGVIFNPMGRNFDSCLSVPATSLTLASVC